jgi:hypothetical protein
MTTASAMTKAAWRSEDVSFAIIHPPPGPDAGFPRTPSFDHLSSTASFPIVSAKYRRQKLVNAPSASLTTSVSLHAGEIARADFPLHAIHQRQAVFSLLHDFPPRLISSERRASAICPTRPRSIMT